MTSWPLRRLDELGLVARGRSRHRPRNDPRLFGGPHPFIQTADIMAADPYITSHSQSLSEFGLAQSKLWPADTLCITIAGANTAQTAILKFPACFPDSVIGFRADPEKSDLNFVKHSLDLMKGRFRAVTRGATQDNLSMEKLLSFGIPTPPLETQRRIADILSAYDEMIEVNQRRIAILEEMARRLFEEWFVCPIGRMPFPGDRAPAMLPAGWIIHQLSEVAKLTMGQSPSSSEYGDDGDGLPFHQGVTDFDGMFHENRLFCRSTAHTRIAEEGDILFSVRAPVARLALSLDRLVLGRGLAAIRSTTGMQSFLYFHLRATFPKPDMFGNGAIYKAVNRDDVRAIPIIDPGAPSIQKFETFASPSIDQIRTLHLANVRLRTARDLLLPKLISGEIVVSAAPAPNDTARNAA